MSKILIDEATVKLALEALETAHAQTCIVGRPKDWWQLSDAITAIKQALEQPVQEPVAMRMPKVGDKVVCIEDESLGTVVYLTAGGSPEIKFDDGSHGTYILREFAELFGYTTPPAQEFICSTGLCHYKPAAAVQSLPFGVGGGLVAIKTLLSRDPCVHANIAIEMIDAILKEHPAAQLQQELNT